MNKSTIVLIPGLLSDGAIWQHQVTTLQPDATIIIPDKTNVNRASDFIENILAKSPPKFYLAGHSMGGWLAIELMRNYSDRVLGLCILATSASLDSIKKMRLRKHFIDLLSTKSHDEVVNDLAGLYLYKPDIKQTIVDMFKRNIDVFVSQQQAMIQRRACEDILPTINVPTLVMVGEQDNEFFKSTKYIANHIPGAEFVVLNDCGHMLMLEQPERCSAIMAAWLKGVEQA